MSPWRLRCSGRNFGSSAHCRKAQSSHRNLPPKSSQFSLTRPTGIYVSLAITGLVIVGLFVFLHRLLFTGFDPVGSQVSGRRTSVVDYILLVRVAVVIVIGIQAAGPTGWHRSRRTAAEAGPAFLGRHSD